MKVKTDTILPAPSDARIKSFEEYCNIEFPQEYKDFLKEYNGAVPETRVFIYNNREYLVERFLCLLEEPESDNKNGWYDIEVVLSQIDTRLTDNGDMIGANIIPIAALFAGDFVCIDLRDYEAPSILIWSHEESTDLNPVTEKIADNLEGFLTILK